MKILRTSVIAALATAAAACGQGNSDNVMAPQGNALQPADVNAALGPEDMNATDLDNAAANLNGIGNGVTNSPAVTESATNNAAE
jgi:hypothetical protein